MAKKVDIMMEICAQLAETENLQITVCESAKSAGIMGFSAFMGGLVGGKKGALVAGAIGTAASYWMTSDFKSIPQIIREDMTETQRKELFKRINGLFAGYKITDVTSGLNVLAKNGSLKSNVLSVLSVYLRNDLGLRI